MTGRVVTIGETMGLVTNAVPGALRNHAPMTLTIGGAESNVAIGLARLGTPVTWLSRVGDDSVGRIITRELRAEGVTVVAEVDGSRPTGLMLKERLPQASSTVSYYRSESAAAAITPAALPDGFLDGAVLLHLSGITPALSAGARDTSIAAIRAAVAAGVPVSLDLNFRSRLWSGADAAAFYREALPHVHTVFAGVDEARLLTGGRGEATELAEALIAAGAQDAVIKDGANGATALIDGRPLSRPAAVVDVVDTVGAGDAFVAGYLSSWLAGDPAGARLDRAVVTGALACTVAGDWEGAPTLAELAAFGESQSVRR